MRLYFFTKYTEKGPSSRYRTYQYLNYFSQYETMVTSFFDDTYSPGKKFSIKYLIGRYVNRLRKMLQIQKNDVVFVEYEFLPYIPFLSWYFKLRKINYIVDYDDAIFHHYDQSSNTLIKLLLKNKIKEVIKNASYVITGSPYLTVYAKKYNSNVVEIPTSIDLEKYQKALSNNFDVPVVGWIGSKTTSKNLLELIPIFEKLQEDKIPFQLRFIGFNDELMNKFEHLPITFVKWNGITEIEEIKKFDVGIMPLENNLFNKGKCAFKLIQYMACGMPTIASSFEANLKVDRNRENLFADSLEEWELAIREIITNKAKFVAIGKRNIKVVQEYYSIQSNNKKYIELIERNTRK